MEGDAAVEGTILAGMLLIGVVGRFGAVGYIYRDQINAFLTQFSSFIEGYGPGGYALFVAVYAGLEAIVVDHQDAIHRIRDHSCIPTANIYALLIKGLQAAS